MDQISDNNENQAAAKIFAKTIKAKAKELYAAQIRHAKALLHICQEVVNESSHLFFLAIPEFSLLSCQNLMGHRKSYSVS